MKKGIIVIVVAVLLAAGVLTGCQEQVVRGSGVPATNEYNFSDFTEVEITSAIKFDIIQSGSYNVSITADDNLFDYILVSKQGTTLRIQMKRALYANISMKAEIAMPNLLGLHVSGASRGTVADFNTTEDLDIDLSGASSLELVDMVAGNVDLGASGASQITGDISAADVDIDLSGASSVQLEGSGDDTVIKASGASSAKLAGFEVNNVDVDLSGASSGTINMDGRLDADLSGASNLSYIGEPTMGNINTSGNSTISKR